MSETNPPQTGAKADDLLAQLAGEEVDRLLAEADVSQAPAEEKTDHVDEQEAAALTSMLEESARKELEQVAGVEIAAADKPQAPAIETPPTEASAMAGAQEDLSAQLDQLFATLTTPRQEQKPEAPPPPAPQAPTGAADPENGAVALDEKTALGEENAESDSPEIIPEKNLAWWARPLAWMNEPFAFLSESTREKLGWIAVQTIIFAALILAYVWWMRGKK